MQHEYSASSRLIDKQTTVTVCGKGDGELTRRLSKWLNKRVRGHKEGAEILERLEALPALCKTN